MKVTWPCGQADDGRSGGGGRTQRLRGEAGARFLSYGEEEDGQERPAGGGRQGRQDAVEDKHDGNTSWTLRRAGTVGSG